MRPLIDHECAAVAGGDTSFCEQFVTTVFIVAGAAGGSGAGGIGAIPGAAYGAVVAEATKGWICGTSDDDSGDSDDWGADHYNDGDHEGAGYSPPATGLGLVVDDSGPRTYAPHQLIVGSPPDGTV